MEKTKIIKEPIEIESILKQLEQSNEDLCSYLNAINLHLSLIYSMLDSSTLFKK